VPHRFFDVPWWQSPQSVRVVMRAPLFDGTWQRAQAMPLPRTCVSCDMDLPRTLTVRAAAPAWQRVHETLYRPPWWQPLQSADVRITPLRFALWHAAQGILLTDACDL
jgi:hypothetical protein